jgi:chemotaxis protein methyltransferase CheR
MTPLALKPDGYWPVYDYIQARTGLHVKENRLADVARTIDSVLADEKLAGVNELLLALKRLPITAPIWQVLIQTITIGETYFYRGETHFEALRSHILPELIAKRRKSDNKMLRLWSAGCASGEEPYSLAMLLHELLPDIDTWHITLLGTDIDLALLERARRGLYRPSSFRNETPGWVKTRWFTPTPAGYELRRTIRDMALFAPLNLAEDGYPSFETGTMKMDLIMCRNVTIYFEQAVVIQIAERFHQALNDGGWLVVGHSEPLAENYRRFVARSVQKNTFYQKDSAALPVTGPLTPSPSDWRVSRPRERDEAQAAPSERPPAPPVLPERPPAPKPDTERLWRLAKDAADNEKWDEALALIAQAEQENRFLPEFHYLRGLIQFLTGDYDAALWSLRQAIYCAPTFVLAHYHLGELYEQIRDAKLAARHWQQALAGVSEMEPQVRLPFADELTVEMFRGLVIHRLEQLQVG